VLGDDPEQQQQYKELLHDPITAASGSRIILIDLFFRA
jgi:hypothetical protein